MALSYPGIASLLFRVAMPMENDNPIRILLIGLGVLISISIIMLIIRAIRKRNQKESLIAQADASVNGINQHGDSIGSYVKRCPTCQSIFADETLAFCLSDGSTLERVANPSASNDPSATLVYREADGSHVPPTVQYHPDMSSNKRG